MSNSMGLLGIHRVPRIRVVETSSSYIMYKQRGQVMGQVSRVVPKRGECAHVGAHRRARVMGSGCDAVRSGRNGSVGVGGCWL